MDDTMEFRQIKSWLDPLLVLATILCIFPLWSCGGGKSSSEDPDSAAGALSFNVIYHNDSGANLKSKQASIDCADQGIATVEAKVYNSNNAFIAGGGPWDCEAGHGTITSVPAGSGLTVVIWAKNADGNIIFSGQKTGILLIAGSENNVGTIDCYAFVPNLLAPTNGEAVAPGDVVLQWQDVVGATEYLVFVSQNSEMSDFVIEDHATTANYTPSGLSYEQTYYWRVFACDFDGNTSIGSEIWSFKVPANTAPVAQINNPVDNSTYTAADEIEFAGTGSDSEDGDLSGASLVWSSDVDGQIGTGETFNSRTLVAGVHLITLTAIDSFGAIGMDSVAITIPAGSLPDTGQDKDQFENYQPTPGEDMTYDINPPAYTKLDNSGHALDASDDNFVMVRDDVTGLIWEAKTDDGGTHDKDKTYTWQDARQSFIAQLNDEKFGGHSDWRLPTIKELNSLVQNINVDPDHPTAKINTKYFPNTIMSPSYWTATTYTGNTDTAWRVYFDDGRNGYDEKSNTFYVRAVRGGQSFNTFEDNDDDTVTDTATGLMWQKLEVETMNWQGALDYCEELDLAGYDDWRLPNTKELQSIVDYEKSNSPYIDEIFENAVASAYWSSTTYAGNTDTAWRVHFNYGDIYYYNKSKPPHLFYVRAVRGGQ
jgi:hypothetical protein